VLTTSYQLANINFRILSFLYQTIPESELQTIITEIEREMEEAKSKANQDGAAVGGAV